MHLSVFYALPPPVVLQPSHRTLIVAADIAIYFKGFFHHQPQNQFENAL